MSALEKIAKILRTDVSFFHEINARYESFLGKRGVLDKIMEENVDLIKQKLDFLGLSLNSRVEDIYVALLAKIETDEHILAKIFNNPSVENPQDWQKILETALDIARHPQGFFLKKEKAAQMLINEPPYNVMRVLGYDSPLRLLDNEDIFEIYAALRFLEGSEWLNRVFFQQYKDLSPADFEKRPLVVRSLEKKWLGLSDNFIKKKYHNISHLKEMGVLFTLPLSLEASGELIRNFSLILHYLNEIPFYSAIFEKLFLEEEKMFADNLIALLRGDVLEERLPIKSESGALHWLVIQRYLTKENELDWRLFVPHINPEALHWERAESLLMAYGEKFPDLNLALSFWRGLSWVGDYFRVAADYKNSVDGETLISFNLIDTAMSLVQKRELIKYRYHHQEALWNKIFSSYFDVPTMEKQMQENILKGWFAI
jgi:hypothetical protein